MHDIHFETHEPIWNSIKQAIHANKIPNAYLFLGSSGIGKDMMALKLAKTLNCLNLTSLTEACNNCESCKQADKFLHPNIEMVFPIVASVLEQKEDSVKEYKELFAKKTINPFFSMKMDKATGILTGQIEQLLEKAQFFPENGKYKIFIISQAERLREDAANKLLKTLEEPPKNILFILIATELEMLLPTIRSRCQIVRFKLLKQKEIYTSLQKSHGNEISDDRLNFAASYARGNYAKALTFISDEEQHRITLLRDQVVDIIRNSLVASKYAEMINGIEKLANNSISRDEKIESLQSLLLFFQDGIHSKVSKPDMIINQDIGAAIEKFAARFGNSDFIKATKLIEDCIYQLSRNANPTLALFTLFLSVRDILRMG